MNEHEDLIIVAETGASHCHSYAKCLALICAAKDAGSDAVKFAVFTPDQMTVNSDLPPFIIADGPWKGRTLYSLYEESALPFDWIPNLKGAVETLGLEFILSIYHPDMIEHACSWGCKTIKISSFELAWPEFLSAIGQSSIEKIILSTGSAGKEEIERAVAALGGKDLTLLHCVSAYPAQAEDMNLNTMTDMALRFGCKVGLSDHSIGLTAPVAAVSLGAAMIEKHLRLDNKGLDSSFAVLPDAFYNMVCVCRQAKLSLGTARYDRPKTYHRKNVDGRMVRVVW